MGLMWTLSALAPCRLARPAAEPRPVGWRWARCSDGQAAIPKGRPFRRWRRCSRPPTGFRSDVAHALLTRPAPLSNAAPPVGRPVEEWSGRAGLPGRARVRTRGSEADRARSRRIDHRPLRPARHVGDDLPDGGGGGLDAEAMLDLQSHRRPGWRLSAARSPRQALSMTTTLRALSSSRMRSAAAQSLAWRDFRWPLDQPLDPGANSRDRPRS